MRKIDLRMNKSNKYEIIKNLVEKDGNKLRAAEKLGCNIRTIYCLINVYKDKGKYGFIQGNRNRNPVKTIPNNIKMKKFEQFLKENKIYQIRKLNKLWITKLILRMLILDAKDASISVSYYTS